MSLLKRQEHLPVQASAIATTECMSYSHMNNSDFLVTRFGAIQNFRKFNAEGQHRANTTATSADRMAQTNATTSHLHCAKYFCVSKFTVCGAGSRRVHACFQDCKTRVATNVLSANAMTPTAEVNLHIFLNVSAPLDASRCAAVTAVTAEEGTGRGRKAAMAWDMIVPVGDV
jgi:hypothetical protein